MQAKKLSLPDIMSRLGYEPTRINKGGCEYWYRSPFRQEKESSFHTSYLGGKWIWNDFGDKGGTVIDFIMLHENFSKVSQALQFLENLFQGHLFSKTLSQRTGAINELEVPFSFQQQSDKPMPLTDARELELIIAHPIETSVIYEYLVNERRIPRNLAERYLLEVKYRNLKTGKEYFAFGMRNESGGYEIRVASSKYVFKSALIARNITFIPGKSANGETVAIFEGMTDFLSYLVMAKADAPYDDCIIMHSLSSFKCTIDFIKGRDYKVISTYLDNNPSGIKHTEKFNREFGEKVKPQSSLFASYEDLNDALRANFLPNFFSR